MLTRCWTNLALIVGTFRNKRRRRDIPEALSRQPTGQSGSAFEGVFGLTVVSCSKIFARRFLLVRRRRAPSTKPEVGVDGAIGKSYRCEKLVCCVVCEDESNGAIRSVVALSVRFLSTKMREKRKGR